MGWISCIIFIVMTLGLICAWRVLNLLWLRPKKLEKVLREQGLHGNSYRILVGDVMDLYKMEKEAKSKPMNLSDDIVQRVSPYLQKSLKIHGVFVLSSTLLFLKLMPCHFSNVT